MKTPIRAFVLSLLMILAVQIITTGNNTRNLTSRTNRTSVPFIKNIGQKNSHVSFYAQTFGGTVFISQEGEIIYSLPKATGETEKNEKSNIRSSSISLQESFLNGRPESPTGYEQSFTKVNHFTGSNTNQWKNNIPTFNAVSLGEVFDGIEVKLRAYGNNVEKLFYVSPGFDYKNIGLSFDGAKSLSVNTSGELEVETKLGTVAFTAPIAYQVYKSGKKNVDVAYKVNGTSYSFVVGDYDKSKILIIDPLLASTFVGGSGTDEDYEPSVAVDNEGNIFFTGSVSSTNFPSSSGAYDESFNGTSDRVISKFSNDLSTLIASTFIGGYNDETGMGFCFDDEWNVYIAGYTLSSDFPTTSGSYDRTINGQWDAFIVKMDNDLSTLMASTYFGGSGSEGEQFPRIDIVIGNSGDVYIAGFTQSNDLPASANSYDNSFNGSTDAFVAKFSPDLSALLGSTYLGGYTDEWRPNIVIDTNENVFVGGSTRMGFPTTPGAYSTTYTGSVYNMFISKLSGDLSNLLASTYLAGSISEDLLGMKLDSENNLYICGYTGGYGYPTTPSAYDQTFDNTYEGTTDGCITKLSNDLSTVLASTLFGGYHVDAAEDLVLDSEGNVYVVGTTQSPDLPMQDESYERNHGGFQDVFVAKFDAQLETLLASTYLGSTRDDLGKCIALDNNNNVIVTGHTASRYFPTTTNAFNVSYNGGTTDCFITKLDSDLSNIVGAFEERELPIEFTLKQNYPNPFNPSTTITFSLPEFSNTVVKVYDIMGSLVNTLVNDDLTAGLHSITWNGKDSGGNEVATGVYFCDLTTNFSKRTIKMNLIK